MLDIIYNLKPFFDDSTKEISVREYARLYSISPPTASKLLKGLSENNILKKRKDRGYLLFRPGIESKTYIELAGIYHMQIIEKSGLIDYLNDIFLYPPMILYGSISKGENNAESDIDICVISKVKKEADVAIYENRLKRKIHILRFSSLKSIENKDLLNNLLNGNILAGSIEW